MNACVHQKNEWAQKAVRRELIGFCAIQLIAFTFNVVFFHYLVIIISACEQPIDGNYLFIIVFVHTQSQ